MKVIEEQQRIHVMEGSWDPKSVIRDIVESGQQEDPFYIMDLGEVVARYHKWKEVMPRVQPFYAVKCNDDRLLVSTLAALGTGFDCASRAEIELIKSIGVSSDRIIFANPAKMASHIRFASTTGVNTMTFDSETELMKIKHHMPHAKVVVRIRCDAADAQCPLGMKFGCDPVTEAPRLIKLAAVMQLDMVGVSFHVGSGARETGVYRRAISYARTLFDLAANEGIHMDLLDIGGGFPGSQINDIDEVSLVINEALSVYFPPESGVEVIAEPGRYFATAAYTLATMVFAKREMSEPESEGGERHTMYFINDGVYGSFNCILYDHQHVTAEPLKPSVVPPLPCSVWGPTCDGLDVVLPRCVLPPLETGQWLVFRDMGAYTLPVASTFNGFPLPKVTPVVDHTLWRSLKELSPLNECVSVSMSPPMSPATTLTPEAMTPLTSAPLTPLTPAPMTPVFVECALK